MREECTNRYVNEMILGGFIDQGETVVAIDRGCFCHVVSHNNNEGGYLVGAFFWEDREYSGTPSVEGTLMECMEFIHDFKD